MAIRILSGIIKPDATHRRSGWANIDFHPFGVSGQVEAVPSEDLQAFGPDAPFTSEPCKAISLMHIRFLDQDHSRHSEAVNADAKEFVIEDFFDPTRRNSLSIRWRAVGIGAEIYEISYMIIGDA